VDFRILGPLEVRNDLGSIDVPGRKPRAVLAVLLLHPNQPVSAERLAVALWGREASAGAIRTVHVNVSRLRKALGGGDGEILTTTPAGYSLRVLPGELDADRFEGLVADGRSALAGGQVDDAGRILREALALWRGPPLADLAFEPFAQAEIARLEEQYEAAIAARVEADLAAGRHVELVGELRRLVAEHPTHERLAGQLMLALYRCGRQADALEAYSEARRRLADELGVEPGDELRALQDAILHQDPKLTVEPAGVLPHELDAGSAPPLVGRERELAWLRDRWDEARAGNGRLIALAGAVGMGKTRLAAELAFEVHAGGGSVLYASGAGPARAVLEVLDRSRGARPPLLLVVDDADHASADVLRAVRDAAGGSVLVLATATVHEALDGLDPGVVLFMDLDRLGPAAVAKIGALYVPDEAAEGVPAEWLLGASAGVPQRVHDVASQWARERVGAVAGHAAAGRSRLRSMEDELAGGVVQLQAVREWREPPEDGEQRVICPFKGLASFEAADAPYFFGRERLVAELVARLVGAPLLGVVGPSGSGKSSVMRAGLLPALESGVLPGSERWRQRIIRPGEHPLRQLRNTLDQLDGESFVLAVDQFEETFTVCRDEREREAFIDELVRAARGEPGGRVVVALRADFYGRCAEYPALSRQLAANHVLVGPMQTEELRRAITCPAQRVGLSVEDELVQAIVDDLEEAPGALPLLSTALLELWQHRDDRRLRLAAYERTGGVRGAVARLAEEAFTHLDDDQRELARRVLLQLVEVDDEGAVERRRIRLTDVGPEAEPLLDVLADRRLVTVSEGTVELAHEALLREWPRLHGWIEDGREDMRIERSLRAGAHEWERVGRDDGALLRGARLAEARDWSVRAGHSLPNLEREFLGASLDRERRDRSARRRVLTLVFGALAVGLVGIAVVAALAIGQRNEAERQRDIATSRALAAQSEIALRADPELAVRLALWALDIARTDQAAAALREATPQFRELASMPADSVNAWAAAYNRDGTRLVTGGDDGRAVVWDVAAEREANEWQADHGALLSARYAPAGDAIALGFDDGTMAVTDPALGERRVILEASGEVKSLAFTGDGERLAVGLDDGTVLVAAVDGSEPRVLGSHDDEIQGVDISADGSRVASAGADGSVILWRLSDGGSQVLHRGQGAWDVAFSPDGRLLLAVGDDGWVRRFDGRSGSPAGRTHGEGAELYTVGFSRDGRRFATGGEDGVIRVFEASGGPSVAVLRGQRSRVYDVGFGAESDRVASAAEDGGVRIWDAHATLTFVAPGEPWQLDFNPDGSMLASSGDDGSVRTWDAATGRPVARLGGEPGTVVGEFSTVSDTVVVGGAGTTVRTWPAAGGPATTVVSVPDIVYAANFDPREERIVYADEAGNLVVRSLASGDEVALGGGPEVIYDAQFSSDGERVAIHPEDGILRVWRLDRPDAPDRELEGHSGAIFSLDYAADGRIVTGGSDGTVRVWPERGSRSLVLRGHSQEVTGVAMYPGGSMVLSTSTDGTLRLWNSRTGVLMARLATSELELDHVTVSQDGTIAYLDDDEVVRVFRCEVCGSLEEVQALARSRGPRRLDAEERERFLLAAG
jgi:WD40 repeat protein/DNA-binding SARP family transcriptional activator